MQKFVFGIEELVGLLESLYSPLQVDDNWCHKQLEKLMHSWLKVPGVEVAWPNPGVVLVHTHEISHPGRAACLGILIVWEFVVGKMLPTSQQTVLSNVSVDASPLRQRLSGFGIHRAKVTVSTQLDVYTWFVLTQSSKIPTRFFFVEHPCVEKAIFTWPWTFLALFLIGKNKPYVLKVKTKRKDLFSEMPVICSTFQELRNGSLCVCLCHCLSSFLSPLCGWPAGRESPSLRLSLGW